MNIITAILNDPNVPPSFKAGIGRPVAAPTTTALADAFDEAIARLTALRASPIVHETHLDNLDPDHLVALAKLEREVAIMQDGIHYAIAVEGGLAETALDRQSWRFTVSSALGGNLDYELTDKADRLREADGSN